MRNERSLIAILAGLILLAVSIPAASVERPGLTAVIVSADAEWRVVRAEYPGEKYDRSPYGEYFIKEIKTPDGTAHPVLFFHGGWGKVSAAGSAQYVIDHWKPDALINLGTCGGFQGAIERDTIVLAERTITYDIIERMGDPDEAIAEMAVTIDLSWLKGALPRGVVRGVLVSGNQDLDPAALPGLRKKYGASAGDWESGAIAYITSRNKTRLLILRGVTDLVHQAGGEAYGNIELFQRRTQAVMKRLFSDLPYWLEKIGGR